MPSRNRRVDRIAVFSRTAASMWSQVGPRRVTEQPLRVSQRGWLFSINCAASSRARVIRFSGGTNLV